MDGRAEQVTNASMAWDRGTADLADGCLVEPKAAWAVVGDDADEEGCDAAALSSVPVYPAHNEDVLHQRQDSNLRRHALAAQPC